MIILAIDSSAIACSVALCEDKKLKALYTINNGNTHSETLLPMIESVLKQSKLTCDDIDLFAVSNGPGSFTGVRIGCATIKGLSFGRNIPCAEISTLEALAMNLADCKGLICPVMNARRSQVYNALFRFENGELKRLCDDRIILTDALSKELEDKYQNEKVYLCGDGYDVAEKEINPEKLGKTNEFMKLQNAYSVALCALNKYKNGEAVTDKELSVTYLRPSQAERERLERLKNQNS